MAGAASVAACKAGVAAGTTGGGEPPDVRSGDASEGITAGARPGFLAPGSAGTQGEVAGTAIPPVAGAGGACCGCDKAPTPCWGSGGKKYDGDGPNREMNGT